MSTPEKTAIRIAVVDDMDDVREGLRYLLTMDDELHVVASFPRAEPLVRQLKGGEVPFDLVLMDIGLPGMSGIEATGLIKEQAPDIKVLVLTVFEDEDRLLSAIRAGADGYLLKNTRPSELIAQIQETCNGGSPVSPAVAGRLLREIRARREQPPAQQYSLTPREQEILRDVVDGLTYREIAERRGIAGSTARRHILHLYRKLNVSSKAEFVRKVLNEDLLQGPGG